MQYIGKYRVWLEFSHTVGEVESGTITLENSLIVSYKVKHTSTPWLRNSTPYYSPKMKMSSERLAYECSLKTLFVVALKLETAQMSNNGRMDKQIGVYNSMKFSTVKKNKVLMPTVTLMNHRKCWAEETRHKKTHHLIVSMKFWRKQN